MNLRTRLKDIGSSALIAFMMSFSLTCTLLTAVVDDCPFGMAALCCAAVILVCSLVSLNRVTAVAGGLLAAAGAVATQYGIPMHEIDVVADKVNVLRGAEQYDALPKRSLYLGIEEFLNLHEAIIDWDKTTPLEEDYFSDERKKKIRRMREFTVAHRRNWNKLSLGLANLCAKQSVHIYKKKKEVNKAARAGSLDAHALLEGIQSLRDYGFLRNLSYDGRVVEFDFSGAWEKKILCSAGAILEHYACAKVMEDAEVNDCGMNYYLNWEGDGDPRHRDIGNSDVINEVDVICMKKSIPTFISCKNYHVTENKVLYEMETVANRFGGTHVRKVLLAEGGAGPSILERAEEMGIRVVRPEEM